MQVAPPSCGCSQLLACLYKSFFKDGGTWQVSRQAQDLGMNVFLTGITKLFNKFLFKRTMQKVRENIKLLIQVAITFKVIFQM